jgi:hypothetical protein
MTMIALLDKKPCSLVKVNRRFRDAYCLYHQVDNDDRGSMYL